MFELSLDRDLRPNDLSLLVLGSRRCSAACLCASGRLLDGDERRARARSSRNSSKNSSGDELRVVRDRVCMFTKRSATVRLQLTAIVVLNLCTTMNLFIFPKLDHNALCTRHARSLTGRRTIRVRSACYERVGCSVHGFSRRNWCTISAEMKAKEYITSLFKSVGYVC